MEVIFSDDSTKLGFQAAVFTLFHPSKYQLDNAQSIILLSEKKKCR